MSDDRSAIVTDSTIDRLFAYGTLLDANTVESIIGEGLIGTVAWLPAHRRVRLKGLPYPGLVVHTASKTEGRMYDGVRPAHWKKLDDYEGPVYERVKVMVLLADGSLTEAFTYALAPKALHLAEDEEWVPPW